MPAIPAFCDTCGTAFPSGIFVENCLNISLSGNKSGPCPKCGGIGHIPDGVFNVVGSTIEILSAPDRTIQELTRLVEILQAAKTLNARPEEVAREIKRDIPALALLLLLRPSSKADWYAFLGILLAIVQVYLTVNPTGTSTPAVTINQVIHQTFVNEQTGESATTKASRKKTGPNEPCPCGSGLKYKKCCREHR